MERHYRILGILFVIWGVWMLLAILLISTRPEILRVPQLRGPFASVAIIVTILIGGYYILTGWALLKRKDWARALSIVASVLVLFNFPFGTALGIYGLWTMISSEGRAEFPRYASRTGMPDQPTTP